jgi:hypothetical protein
MLMIILVINVSTRYGKLSRSRILYLASQEWLNKIEVNPITAKQPELYWL